MKKIIRILPIALLIVSSNIFGQDFQGVATYKYQRKMDVKLDSSQISPDMQKQIMAMMKKQFEKTYVLTFSKNESLYKEDKPLESPQLSGVRVVVANGQGSDIMYKNIKNGNFSNQNEILGKVFLIEDDIVNHDWKLSSETKNIGEYTCFKATTTVERPRQRQIVQGGRSASNNSSQNTNDTSQMEEITVTAWYTTQIPVNNGPGKYQGLPGLILEVNDGTETMLCNKVVLNPKNRISIKKPVKGQKVNQKEYDKILAKKRKEMGVGNGQRVRIRDNRN